MKHRQTSHASLSGRGRNSHPQIDALLPSPNQKAALFGSTDTPSLHNPYVTNTDLELAEARITALEAALFLKTHSVNVADTSRVQASGAADITGFTITVIVPTGGGNVQFAGNFMARSSSNTYGFHLHLYRTASLLRTFTDVIHSSNQGRHFISWTILDRAVPAGTYYYKARWAPSGGTGHTTYANNGRLSAILTGLDS